ncbi:hypothetical protein DGG96_02590 [Legionella qingyii]|uniref:Coiled coil domain-containing protein n=1 Tax=Legionella qingyii TaxID=2184757 RepID=A0A317U8H2_9GAMM|nr:hypothetical protein [Legionella qingyii]PWY56427.1 hypothetical protein DGG96_06600 [Legionella qingyii]PWY57216.1 hypothetical protein DGG96_02590 [Legionella qingyii]RUR24944.1 hypothetical protein ELY20_04090 [Legionella qingyii]
MPSHRQAFFNLLNSQYRKRQFAPGKLEEIYQQYRDDITLTQDLTFGLQAFEEYTNKRIKDHKGFKIQIGPEEGDTLEKALKGSDSTAKDTVRNKLNEVFTPEKFYAPAQEKYQESIEAFKKRVSQVPGYSIELLRGELEKINQDAKNAIIAQQKMEVKRLKETFENSAFMTDFKNALGKDPDEAEKVKKELIAELEKKHSEQLGAFNKVTQENLTTLDKASALEKKQILFSGQLESWANQLSQKDKDKMLLEMEQAREKNRERRNLTRPEELTTGTIDVKEKTISTINPEDLEFIISLSGAKIKHTKGKENEPGIWSVEMPARILSPFYYLSRQENPKVDMLTMAQAVRASGFDAITLTINFDDPKTQKQRARQAYEAALESGFAPGPLPGEESKGDKAVKGIVLKDREGKEIDPTTLFTPSELKVLHEHAKERRDKLAKLLQNAPKETVPEETSKKFRSELDEGRNKIRTDKGKNAIDKELEQQQEVEIKTILNNP